MNWEAYIEELERSLSHGSGIDGRWNIEDKGRYIKACNFYHCMNSVGYYNGFASFTLIIPKKNPLDFRLHFNGKEAAYKNRQYQLREYLEDVFYCDLEKVNDYALEKLCR